MSPAEGVLTLTELLAHAFAIESEAADRYVSLADQMSVHHNSEVEALFRKLADIEGKHAKKILEQVGDSDLPGLAPWGYLWGSSDSPEAAGFEEAHYLMTPHHALTMMLGAEERALKFYDNLAQTTPDGPVKNLAQAFAEEEREHVRLVREWLAKYPAPEDGWDEDADPPAMQE